MIDKLIDKKPINILLWLIKEYTNLKTINQKYYGTETKWIIYGLIDLQILQN